jgi:FkbM family methyltransferase
MKESNGKLDWGQSTQWFKEDIGAEILDRKIYEMILPVQKGDIIFDAGSSIGLFGYSVLDRMPSRIYCIDPSVEEMKTCKVNIPADIGIYLNYGISDTNGEVKLDDVYENGSNKSYSKFKVKRFKTIIEENNIEKIDFLKTDCEGGEYSIFTLENLFWIKDNVKKIVGEWHLNTPETKQQFREFRDTYLKLFPNHEVYSCDDVDIKWDLWNDHFIEYYTEVIIHIDNRTKN